MDKDVNYLLLGGGLAAATAAETLRCDGARGSIVMLASEDTLPYHRPPLSKEYLLKDEEVGHLLVHPAGFYEDNDIDVRLGARAVRVDIQNKIVTTNRAESFHYKKLLIATGSRVRRLPASGGNLRGVYYLRTLADAAALRTAIASAKKAVVIGSSFIGMELAAVFAARGLHTTVIARDELLYDPLESPEISSFFADYYRARGVEIISGQTVTALRGDTSVNEIVTDTDIVVPCDIVAIGAGVAPDVGCLEGSGLALDDGVLVNQYLQSSDMDVFAAGDVARFYDPVIRRHRRIEHWDNAVKQGRIAARNMLDKRQSYRDVSIFFSDVFDISFNFIGDPQGHDQRIVRTTAPGESFAVLYTKDDNLKAGFFLKQPPVEEQAAASMILNRTSLTRVGASLADISRPLARWASQTVLILQGGGALGAFECGVVKALEEQQIFPDVAAGVSIGAFNAAIIASHPRHATSALEAFWGDLSMYVPPLPDETMRRTLSSWTSLTLGNPRFFRPRWLWPAVLTQKPPLQWTSYYDPSPVKDLLCKYVDFQKLKDSPVRLLINTVNVETAELETFDSYIEALTADHLLASGSLPPGFPWTTINGRHYWDGGMISNSPLDQVVERCGLTDKKVYIVNLYPGRKRLPTDLSEVTARRDEIIYAERIRQDIRVRETIENYKQLVQNLIDRLAPDAATQIRQHPLYIETVGQTGPISITRIVHEGEPGEGPSKDYEFSAETIDEHIAAGYAAARKALGVSPRAHS
ncbi:MAG TPA: FAD-dependent oxidoreductase [Gammaproteobacteria bacterium]|nr:FAD-dependent oxidoreductase [Gammaproteobacteria bacterium]